MIDIQYLHIYSLIITSLLLRQNRGQANSPSIQHRQAVPLRNYRSQTCSWSIEWLNLLRSTTWTYLHRRLVRRSFICKSWHALSLFMLRVSSTHDIDSSFTFNRPTILTHFLHRWTHLHDFCGCCFWRCSFLWRRNPAAFSGKWSCGECEFSWFVMKQRQREQNGPLQKMNWIGPFGIRISSLCFFYHPLICLSSIASILLKKLIIRLMLMRG